MKATLFTLLTFFALISNAQNLLVPGKNTFEKKWIRLQEYKMQWFTIRDTNMIEIGEVTTKFLTDKNKLTIVTSVEMKNSKTPWIDSTVASLIDLSPIRHTSNNARRNMALNFGSTVTGIYEDKIKGIQTNISDTPKGTYFDSNLYPMLISWLPLKENLKSEISIYDYNPTGKIGITKAWVKNVTNGSYATSKYGTVKVWIVSVEDGISNGQTSMNFYIGQADRKLWKQEINASGRKMVMQRME